MSCEHVLSALEPDNLLAFLGLLGFHRALEHAAPEWNPRVYWTGVPLRPRLTLSNNVGRTELLETAARGCESLAKAHSFDRKDINYKASEARLLLKEACDADPQHAVIRIQVLTALMNDKAVKDDGTVRATPLCAMFGQGHQHFLQRLAAVANGDPPKELKKELTRADLNSVAKLNQAIFIRWQRNDRTQSFRWDPMEDRRYALRFEDPSTDKGLTVHGANRLASLALPLFPALLKRERGEVRLYTIATNWDPATGLRISWPIWSRPASLRSVVMMLAGCGTRERYPGLGITDIYSSERISVGKFFNFTRAVPIGRT